MLACLVAVLAQTYSGSFSESFGTPTFGGTVSGSGTITNTLTTHEASAGLAADISLFGTTYDAVDVTYAATQSFSTAEATATVAVGGVVVWSGSAAGNWTWDWGTTLDVVDVSTVVLVGGVPVSLGGTLTVDVDAEVSLAVVPSGGAGADGVVGATLSGTASVGVTLFFLTLSLDVVVTFIEATLEAGLNANMDSLAGYATLTVGVPLELEASLTLSGLSGTLAGFLVYDADFPVGEWTLLDTGVVPLIP